MDVRCERCQTEYQVEDANVSDLGTEVQCSDCGHQFMVKRPNGAANRTSASREPDANEAGTWVIETTAGRSLRLRDLTTLHKWIVEHRVGRGDRLSRAGDPWQRLGDMAELTPFFDIVDSAERARSSNAPLPAPLLAPLAVPALEPPVPQPERTSFTPSLDQRPGHRVIVPPAAPARAANLSLPSARYHGDADKTVIIRLDHSKPRSYLKLIIPVVVASVVAYAGILLVQQCMRPAMRSSQRAAETPAQPEAPQVEVPTPLAPAAVQNEAAEEEGGGSPTHGPLVQPITDSKPSEKVPLLGRAAKRAAAGKPTGARKVKVQPSVSAAKPNAPPALATQGYVALNHHQPSRAVALFKRALASNPSNGTALFGLAEAYQSNGQIALALHTYRRYVETLPSGPDAASARTQIRVLENKKR
jgi:predicted Zn finger-like uncharacterized protein